MKAIWVAVSVCVLMFMGLALFTAKQGQSIGQINSRIAHLEAISVGMSRDAVIERMGQPTHEFASDIVGVTVRPGTRTLKYGSGPVKADTKALSADLVNWQWTDVWVVLNAEGRVVTILYGEP